MSSAKFPVSSHCSSFQRCKARKLQALNATSSSGKSSLGETITPGRAPNESLHLYEPLFPIDGPALIHKKLLLWGKRKKHIWKHISESLSDQGSMGALWESSCYLPQTAVWTVWKCLHGQILLLSASVLYACKLCCGICFGAKVWLQPL